MKYKMDLQLFAEAVQGKKIVYLFRVLSDAATKAGALLAFTTENGRTVSVDADSTATKDGPVRTSGTPEIEITASALLAKGDTMIDSLESAMLDNKLVECWEANLEEAATGENATNKFKGVYYQGYITEIERTSNAEDNVEISLTYGANGKGASGDVTVTADQQAMAVYVFADSTQKTGV